MNKFQLKVRVVWQRFRLFQTERACRRQFEFDENGRKFSVTGRKHCGERRNCSLRAIYPFPTLFSKDFNCRRVNTRGCLAKGFEKKKNVGSKKAI